ncbi:MAG TPA: integrase core domain-containing protein [Pyrinomonadaceae bacterium]|nr:integrase core domain-containing protein [Pyrinomonadaceae bacterium]
MPWKETSVMDQRIQLIADWLSGHYRKSELCRIYEVSRPTADKWIARYEQRGLPGLEELGRAPHSHPNQTPEEMRALIVQTKLQRQKWGPKKVLDWLRDEWPEVKWPADSTAGEILKRAGLVKARKRRRRVAPYSEPFGECCAPNQSWSADFKGDFLLGNGRRCYPLTISDNFSRYLLLCRALERPRQEEVRYWFEWVFREAGLPEVIRTDNGAPFASLALGGISQLSKWWIKLGIKPERIQPGKPAQNGRHERMHRTLKEAVAPQRDLQQQQQQYDPFVEEYNWDRSHEALERKPPGSIHCFSPRSYPAKLPEVQYESGITVRQVRHKGEIKWRGELIYISEVLAKEPIGLKPIDNDKWELRYSFHPLGVLDERNKNIIPAKTWRRTKTSKV